ncbi:hypothetical protein ABW19_dt0200984 [Dactylella cylindrospora]|nr:hypothetical protein ABW19_dt0200984 [Dactylella cylindrospora]
MTRLLAFPNEILSEIVEHIVPDFDDDEYLEDPTSWRTSPHIRDLQSLSLTCKQLSAFATPRLYRVVVLGYPTSMIRLLRTLIENPASREMIRTLSICCPLNWCDTIIDPFSPRETFLDDNPELTLDMKWDTESMDEYAASIFRNAGLDREEYKAFTESELEALNDGGYWLSIPSWSERVRYEEALMQGLASALIALSPRTERLCMWPGRDGGRAWDLEYSIKKLVNDEKTRDRILTKLTRLELRDSGSDYFEALSQIPSISKLLSSGVNIEDDDNDLQIWHTA